MRWISVAALLALPLPAFAFHGGGTFERSANEGGGAGMFFDGSPRFKRYTCAACHVETCPSCHDEDMRRTGEEFWIERSSEPPDFFEGRWHPGETVRIHVGLHGTHLGFQSRPRIRTFVAEIDTDDGRAVGTWAFDDRSLLTWDGGRVLAARGIEENGRGWSFEVTMPEAGTGRLTFHLAAVSTIARRNDVSTLELGPLDDDFSVLEEVLCEGDSHCDRSSSERSDPDSPAALGCSAAGSPSSGAAIAWLLPVAAIAWRRRKGWVLVALLAGCFDPHVPSECRDRTCGDAGEVDGAQSDPPLDECDVSSCTLDADCEAACPPAPEGYIACCHGDDGCRFDSGSCEP